MILQQILAAKKQEIAAQKAVEPLEKLTAMCEVQPAVRSFLGALQRPGEVAVIAEIKRRSPSKGLIRSDFAPAALAAAYAAAGAAAISVLTDEPFFGGHLRHLPAARAAVALPLLRKDFIIDPYQLAQARAYGADAVLLIVAVLSPGQLQELHVGASELGMDALVEVHTAAELQVALDMKVPLMGINNRDLATFRTSLAVTRELAPLVPPTCTLVSESGIRTAGDLAELQACGVRAVLVGESLLRQPDVGQALRQLCSGRGMTAAP